MKIYSGHAASALLVAISLMGMAVSAQPTMAVRQPLMADPIQRGALNGFAMSGSASLAKTAHPYAPSRVASRIRRRNEDRPSKQVLMADEAIAEHNNNAANNKDAVNSGNDKSSQEEAHHPVFDSKSSSTVIYMVAVGVTGLANLLACIYIIRRTHPLRITKSSGNIAPIAPESKVRQLVRSTIGSVPTHWTLAANTQQPMAKLTRAQQAKHRRHEDHKLAFYTTTADLMITLMVTASVAHSYQIGHMMDGLACNMVGFGVYSIILLDITMVMLECLIMWMAFSNPRRASAGASSRRWLKYLLFFAVPWIIGGSLASFDTFGNDTYWCFVKPQMLSGKVALSIAVLFHYSVLLIVLLCFVPVLYTSDAYKKMAAESKSTGIGRLDSLADSLRSNRSNVKHMLVHIIHYTPGTIHLIASLCGFEHEVLFILGVSFVQLGAVMHAYLIWSHERHHKTEQHGSHGGHTRPYISETRQAAKVRFAEHPNVPKHLEAKSSRPMREKNADQKPEQPNQSTDMLSAEMSDSSAVYDISSTSVGSERSARVTYIQLGRQRGHHSPSRVHFDVPTPAKPAANSDEEYHSYCTTLLDDYLMPATPASVRRKTVSRMVSWVKPLSPAWPLWRRSQKHAVAPLPTHSGTFYAVDGDTSILPNDLVQGYVKGTIMHGVLTPPSRAQAYLDYTDYAYILKAQER
ncbi:hypothetical protein THASP1DRAFT_30047 [Thamnocephalis sphaerospora]|uniref:G-protein coupled receptors family 1 profile domain-containing protein n=1 Tax=Thamnocephalis sphaerospora TaxID=78915 RepID=A0A4P9XS32_9FUNG|nr:hypothetical protein THASP1DRAFT_30047 [Thamnocephalis sphaerospora]|eukprot:RKP08150.1 hypothetical protein THASP1DRAFT_30047 [Thamnocephalis sphaerospora]